MLIYTVLLEYIVSFMACTVISRAETISLLVKNESATNLILPLILFLREMTINAVFTHLNVRI